MVTNEAQAYSVLGHRTIRGDRRAGRRVDGCKLAPPDARRMIPTVFSPGIGWLHHDDSLTVCRSMPCKSPSPREHRRVLPLRAETWHGCVGAVPFGPTERSRPGDHDHARLAPIEPRPRQFSGACVTSGLGIGVPQYRRLLVLQRLVLHRIREVKSQWNLGISTG
jgi:hypothetical protein